MILSSPNEDRLGRCHFPAGIFSCILRFMVPEGAKTALNGDSRGRMLSLNGFLLRSGSTPANAWTDSAFENVEIFSWEKGQLEPLSPDDAEILDAVAEGDIIVALIRRFTTQPPWQAFIKDAFNLTEFGAARESLGAAVFCAASAAVDDGAVRWVAWTFGTAGRALRRSAQIQGLDYLPF